MAGGQRVGLLDLVDQRDVHIGRVDQRGGAGDLDRAIAHQFAAHQLRQCRQSRRHIGILSVMDRRRSIFRLGTRFSARGTRRSLWPGTPGVFGPRRRASVARHLRGSGIYRRYSDRAIAGLCASSGQTARRAFFQRTLPVTLACNAGEGRLRSKRGEGNRRPNVAHRNAERASGWPRRRRRLGTEGTRGLSAANSSSILPRRQPLPRAESPRQVSPGQRPGVRRRARIVFSSSNGVQHRRAVYQTHLVRGAYRKAPLPHPACSRKPPSPALRARVVRDPSPINPSSPAGDDVEVQAQHEQHQADDEHEAQVVEGHHDLLAHRAAQDAFQNQEHHVPAVQ